MNPRLGLLLLFEGDYRKVTVNIKNVTAFTAVSTLLKNGDNDVTSIYINPTATFIGSLLVSDVIGGKAALVAGSYRYFISGTYGGKKRTWYFDVLVLPKDTNLLKYIDIPLEDYDPLIETIGMQEGDNFAKRIVIPGAEFTSVSAVLMNGSDNVTGTYCSGSASISAVDELTTHNIGGVGSIVASEYGYFITGIYNEGETCATWFFPITVLPNQGVL